MFTVLVSTAAALALTPPDVCPMLSRTEAAAILGQPVTEVVPGKDESSSEKQAYCIYRSAGGELLTFVSEFSSAAEAKKQMTARLAAAQAEVAKQTAATPAAEKVSMSEEAGVGEKALWTGSGQGAMYAALQGNRLIGAVLGGQGMKDPASKKAALKGVVASTLAKLK